MQLCIATGGSHPRMRGKDFFLSMLCVTSGITPAHAGKSSALGNAVLGSKDHPRACGEKFLYRFLVRFFAGSPPRMRGKDPPSQKFHFDIRITPAHAGKRIFMNKTKKCCKDHPRACGEKPARSSSRAAASGSPPRMRGKVVGFLSFFQLLRITPAHAGKRPQTGRWSLSMWDHPRACGEKCGWRDGDWPTSGSPPRMRGKAA